MTGPTPDQSDFFNRTGLRTWREPHERPRDWRDNDDPEHLKAELRDVDQCLIDFGIDYPRGARGVKDLAGFAKRSSQLLSEVIAVVGLPPDGDMDGLADHVRGLLPGSSGL